MASVRLLIVAAFVSLIFPASLTAGEKNFSVALKGSLTTGSQLFPNPNSTSAFQRAEFFSLKNVWAYGAEVRYRFPETDLALGISADYLRTTEAQRPIIGQNGKQVPVTDGYRVIPVEVTGYFIIPISGETIGVYMGGGAGAYFGRRIYRIGDTEAQTIDAGNGFGIHVLSGISWRFNDFFSLNAEMKFRDLQFNSTNQFSSSPIVYGNLTVQVPTQPFESRVHTDGMIFQFGAVIDF
ncbi:MAG: outer membrane beta-barrel protein [bacterium]